MSFRLLSSAATALVLLSGCGSTDEDPSGPEPPRTRLVVAYDPGTGALAGPGDAGRRTIECPGDPLCDRLERVPAEAFEPVPPNVACTAIYGGPRTATVTGTLRGKRIDARFKRTNGCEVNRWKRLEWLLEP